MSASDTRPGIEARAAAEQVARASYGRLVALLARTTRDLAAAEDALSTAFATALRVWPAQGVPRAPEAWLLTVARRHHGHAARAGGVRARAQSQLQLLTEVDMPAPDAEWPDARLPLLFVCAHPAIDPVVRAPLMLQTVLGLDAARIASAFLVPATTMSQRLVRAKSKIRDAGLAFTVPELDEHAERLADVLQAIYAAYGTGWDEVPATPAAVSDGLIESALDLARLLVDLLPAQPEPKGLLALMLYCEARRPARRDANGRFVPLEEQDTTLWDVGRIKEAEAALTRAAAAGQFGRFQTEAAIQSVHCQRAITGQTAWPAILALYDVLCRLAPSIGGEVGRAAALLESGQPEAALARLDRLPPEAVAAYQPYWAVRAQALQRTGAATAAGDALQQAVALTTDPAVRAHLLRSAH